MLVIPISSATIDWNCSKRLLAHLVCAALLILSDYIEEKIIIMHIIIINVNKTIVKNNYFYDSSIK